MNKSYIIILIFTLISCRTEEDSIAHCGSEFCTSNGSKELLNIQKLSRNLDPITINIKLWNASKSVFEEKTTDTLMNILNSHFLKSNIKFEKISFNKTNLAVFNLDQLYRKKSFEKIYSAINKDNSAIQIIILPHGTHLNGYTRVLTENFESYKSKNLNTIYISDKAFINQTTLSHELGHFFGLQHTFGKSPKENSTNENPNGENCETTGDYICDTKADPNGRVNSDCEYIGMSNGEKFNYNPPIHNFMSYYLGKCKNEFTTLQSHRMHQFALHYRQYLIQ